MEWSEDEDAQGGSVRPGCSEGSALTAKRIPMQHMLKGLCSIVISCALAFIAISCARPQKYIDITCGKMPGETLLDREAAIQCQQFRQEEAATAVYNEATLLMKSYRACLEKYEQTPVRAREYCAMYGKALQDIGLQIKEPLDASLTGKEAAQTPSKSKF
jgi:hypothetical protein